MKLGTVIINPEECDKILRKMLKDKDITSIQALKDCLLALNLMMGFILTTKLREEFMCFLETTPGNQKFRVEKTVNFYFDFQKNLLSSEKSELLNPEEVTND